MDKHHHGLSRYAQREIMRSLSGLSDSQADRLAVLLEERGPLAGALNPPWEPWEKRISQTRDEVEELVIVVFDQHVLDATEPDREASDLALLFEAVTDVRHEC